MILAERCVDLMLAAFNRLEFTQECLRCLLKNTAWKYVRKLTVYDSGSTDGTHEAIEQALAGFNDAPFEIVTFPKVRPIVEIQNLHIQKATAPLIAKIDNDTLVPPRWLELALTILAMNPDVGILGLEPIYEPASVPLRDEEYQIEKTEHVGGLFLARASVFRGVPPPRAHSIYFGFTEWQRRVIPSVKKAWIKPSIPLILLDRVPFEPWASHSVKYISKGWQRPWSCYPPDSTVLRWRWPIGTSNIDYSISGLRVDLGPADRYDPGFDVYVDLVASPNIPAGKMKIADLRKEWPFADSSVAFFRAHDIIEHLPDKVHTMNEIHRCLAPGGIVEIRVPTIEGVGAVCDPQHASLWSRASFDYFIKGEYAHTRLAPFYGITAAFDVVSEEKTSTKRKYRSGEETTTHLKIVLRARKRTKRSWSVIIPSNSTVRLRRAVESILISHPDIDPAWIIAVDDGAKAEWKSSDPNITWVEGKKPFIYARNVNLGIAAAPPDDDIILMGDDCEVMTPLAFFHLQQASQDPKVGIVSAGINGPVGNPLQKYNPAERAIECDSKGLAFVCVYIPRRTINTVGLLDERYIGYGLEDKDFCQRTEAAGFKLMIHRAIEVGHNRPGMESAWRTRADCREEHNRNKQIFEEKWKRSECTA